MEINMLAKLKTRKGGLGKNEHPDGLTTFKGNSGKSRGKQENYSPVGRKPERAIQAKMGWWKNEKMKWKKTNMQKHWPPMRCPKHLRDCSHKQQYLSNCFPLRCYSFLPSMTVSMYFQTTASPEEGPLQIYVRARATTCPIFQWFVCLCETVSTNCQSSCIPKHSYMHNHASYMFMHLIKLSCYSYASAFSIPMLIPIRINHVNFKFLFCQQ